MNVIETSNQEEHSPPNGETALNICRYSKLPSVCQVSFSLVMIGIENFMAPQPGEIHVSSLLSDCLAIAAQKAILRRILRGCLDGSFSYASDS